MEVADARSASKRTAACGVGFELEAKVEATATLDLMRDGKAANKGDAVVPGRFLTLFQKDLAASECVGGN